MARDLAWLVARLRAMGPTEIAHRIAWEATKARWRSKSWPDTAPAYRWSSPPSNPTDTVLDSNADSLRGAADAVLSSDYLFLGQHVDRGSASWHVDPLTGAKTLLSFGPDINYRDAALAGDARTTWELNRLQHTSILAAAYAATGDETYATAAAADLTSWAAENPFPLGINWCSSLEVGLRLISFAQIERLIRPSSVHKALFGPNGTMWAAIYYHQMFVASHWAGGSSANNHLIGEAAGLFVASTAWPMWPESERWQATSRDILESEIARQTFPDGLNREQAFGYHLFVAELFSAAGVAGVRAGVPMSQQFDARLRTMLEAIPPLVDANSNLPRWGDSDDARGYRLGDESERLGTLFHLGRRWLGARVPDPGALGMTEFALLAPEFARPGAGVLEVALPAESPAVFPDAGIHVMADHSGTPSEILVMVDTGPLGFLSIAAHGHADALSVTLAVGGTPVLVDPGTYRYAADEGLRSYFRSTLAHNTVCIDRQDQSVSGGPFLWTKPVETRVLSCSIAPLQQVTAEHSGYSSLPGAPVHRRSVELAASRLLISDIVDGSGTHRVDVRLHFDPACEVELSGDTAEVRFVGGRAIIELDSTLTWRIVGREEGGGLYSGAYNALTPTTTLEGTADNAQLPMSARTEIRMLAAE